MERTRQRSRLVTARRGHKLLKDKSDEMLRHLFRMIKQNRALREQVEGEIMRALGLFRTARVHMTATEIENATGSCSNSYKLHTASTSIMGLEVPKVTLTAADGKPYSTDSGADVTFLTTHPSFDKSVQAVSNLLEQLVELATIEKACSMLAAEIQRLRRRINALEYKVIPEISETIRFITMKLAENERGNIVRLVKVKEMLTQQEE